MSGAGIIIFIIVLVILGVGGYFGYMKLYKPYRCVNRDADTKLNIKTFMWDNMTSNCIANVCTSTFGTDANGKPANKTADGDSATCPPYTAQGRSYSKIGSGKCTNITPTSVSTTTTTADLCKTSCDTTNGCNGYDWSDTPATCELYPKTPSSSDGTTTGTCYAYTPTASKTK